MLLVLFCLRRQNKIHHSVQDNLQIQIHQLRNNEVIEDDSVIKPASQNAYQKI